MAGYDRTQKWDVNQPAPTMSKVRTLGSEQAAYDALRSIERHTTITTMHVIQVLRAFDELNEHQQRNLLHHLMGR